MKEETQVSVEDLFRQIDDIDSQSNTQFSLVVPNRLTLNGRLVRSDVGAAILLDRILGKGYHPDGFIEKENGRTYRYTRSK
jgi:hypothetical protein